LPEQKEPIQPYSPIHYIHQVSIEKTTGHAMSWYYRGSANDYDLGLSFVCVHGDKSTLLLKYTRRDAQGEIPLNFIYIILYVTHIIYMIYPDGLSK